MFYHFVKFVIVCITIRKNVKPRRFTFRIDFSMVLRKRAGGFDKDEFFGYN